MQVLNSFSYASRVTDPRVGDVMEVVSESWLRQTVSRIAVPRNFTAEPERNAEIATWIEQQLQGFGYQTHRQGTYDNIATYPSDAHSSVILIGAHYDSVPGTPGADDNGSAVAAMLACAKAVSPFSAELPVCFVAFNREEEGLLGSRDFVTHFVVPGHMNVREAHILEMVGYRSFQPGSQRLPAGLPIQSPRDAGDFLALVANNGARKLPDELVQCARDYLPEFPVLALKVFLGMERMFPHLLRSDHTPFWEARIPAMMWTDTAEFRNPHYHQTTDTPDTLDYAFCRQIAQLLIARVMTSSTSS